MSRNRQDSPKENGKPNSGEADGLERATHRVRALYGSDAPTAVAYCALDAWLDGEEVEFRELAGLFRRLKN
ncbi:hypothetical protein [Rhizobium sp. SL42]|uniref:hypothetical protein n=1 Tax=Rhizobium sp. SL42 TaxID=2806346 RepID=UPI001F3B7916|nr:hypothetical protein [Rhizobium sp. SL42]UJW77828.1 hypothetical protein IM739_22785 [Rhizobium sp. SL42]